MIYGFVRSFPGCVCHSFVAIDVVAHTTVAMITMFMLLYLHPVAAAAVDDFFLLFLLSG